MARYRIKEGVEFKPYGKNSLITNSNLTDTMAEMFISKNPDLLGQVFETEVKQESKKRGRKKNKS